MDVARFDWLTRRWAATLSRRRFAGGLAGLGLGPVLPAAAKNNRQCKHGKQRCGRACVDTRIDPRHCGRCDRHCAAGQECVAGSCRAAGQGSCTGQNGCVDDPADAACGRREEDCFCVQRLDGTPFCGQNQTGFCLPCTADLACVDRAGAGFVCVYLPGTCCGPFGDTGCMRPCGAG